MGRKPKVSMNRSPQNLQLSGEKMERAKCYVKGEESSTEKRD